MGKKDLAKKKKVKGDILKFHSISLPFELVQDLKLLKEIYEEVWFDNEKNVPYEKVFERLLSKSGLGHVDKDIYQRFVFVKEQRRKHQEEVEHVTREHVEELAARAEANGTTLLEEAGKEQQNIFEKMNAQHELFDRCDAILAAAELPTPGYGWVKNRWFVHPETGIFYPVYSGVNGLTDYARDVDGKRSVSAPEMERRGFMQHNFDGTSSKETWDEINSLGDFS